MVSQETSLKEPIMVSIRCLAYNHEPYIRQCLEGFVMQKTNFRFEAIVHDDASTDGTATIIREYAEQYPDIIKPIYETENQYSKRDGSLRRIMDAEMRGKYIAMCEGDDYWTDPYKLQKQVDFMEAHSDYSMCYHVADYIKGTEIIGNDRNFENDCEVSTSQVIAGGGLFCATASLLYRNGIITEIPQWRKMADVGDYPLQIQLTLLGRVWCFSDSMSVYRTGHTGSWMTNHSNNIIHYKNVIKWLNELDKSTEKRYHKSIVYRVFIYSLPLCRARQLSIIRFLCRYAKLDSKSQKRFLKQMGKAVICYFSPKLYQRIIE